MQMRPIFIYMLDDRFEVIAERPLQPFHHLAAPALILLVLVRIIEQDGLRNRVGHHAAEKDDPVTAQPGSDGSPRCWYADVPADRHTAEIAFLRAEIYQREVDVRSQTLTALERFSTRL